MLRVESGPAGPVVAGELPPGTTAYVDADWLPPEGPVPALVRTGDGMLRWLDGEPVPEPPGLAPDAAAALALLAVAWAAAAAAGPVGPDSVRVEGRGLIADSIRRRLGLGRSGPLQGRSPAVVVDASGDPRTIEEATHHLRNLGTLVIVGQEAGRPLDLNLYRDVHKRGLRLVGIAPPLAGPLPAPAPDERAAAETAAAAVGPSRLGQPLTGTHLWYRFSA